MVTSGQLIQLIKKSVRATDPDATLILFGSYARGEQKPDSDIDILVLIDKDKITFDDRERISNPLYDLELETEQQISPVIFSKKNWETKYRITPFYQNVKRDGIVL